MWGNRLGWTISALICVMTAFLTYQLYQLGRPTPPSGDLRGAIKPLTLADGARALLPPAKPLGDAGDDYRSALIDYESGDHAAAYEALATSKDSNPAAVESLKGLAEIVDGTACPTMDLFRSKPGDIINYNQTVPALDHLQAMAKAAGNVAFLATFDKDYATGRKYAQAVLAMGLHLYQERLTYDELEAGVSLMGTGVALLKSIAEKSNDAAALTAATTFDQARLDEYQGVLQPVWHIMTAQDDPHIARYAGDYLQLANDKQVDPVWRTEAYRRLGRLQKNAPARADSNQATVLLKAAVSDPTLDPISKQAASSALNISGYENQSQR